MSRCLLPYLWLLPLAATVAACNWLVPLDGPPLADAPAAADGTSADRTADLPLAGPDGPGDNGMDQGGDQTTPPCVAYEIPVTGDPDDGEISIHDSQWFPQGEVPPLATGDPPGIYIGRWLGAPTWGYFRFRLPVAVPAGATLVDGALALHALHATANWASSSGALMVGVENSPDAPQVSDTLDAPDSTSGRTLVSPMRRWPETGLLSWPVGSTASSPSLAHQLQVLVNTHGGLSKGAHLQLWARGEGYKTDAEVATADTSRAPADAARLQISWCK